MHISGKDLINLIIVTVTIITTTKLLVSVVDCLIANESLACNKTGITV